MATLGVLYQQLRKNFTAHGHDNAALDARLLIQHVTGLDHASFIADPTYPLRRTDIEAIERLGQRRLSGEPVGRIIGQRAFYGRDFSLGPATLEPRPDSETVIDTVVEWVRLKNLSDQPLSILDLGTGSGILALTLLAEFPQAQAVASDIAADALSISARNADQLGVSDRVRFMRSNWFDEITGVFDIIVANPPYIKTADMVDLPREVALYDPVLALDGGGDGLTAYRHIAVKITQHLNPGGFLAVETGYDQTEAVYEIFLDHGLKEVPAMTPTRKDLAGNPRVICLQAK